MANRGLRWVLVLAAVAAAACKIPSPSPIKRTIADMRNAGVALDAWYIDNFEAAALSEPTGVVDWSQCQPISHAELAAKLQPQYTIALPEEDGWRRPFEYCLDQESRPPKYYGIRSSGADGHFEGPRYRVGSFPATETGPDFVWLNSYFIAWPGEASPGG